MLHLSSQFFKSDIAPLVLVVAGGVIIWALRQRLGNRRKDHLPPGPKGLPLVGNAFQIPIGRTWLKFDEWGKEFGPIYTIYIFSKPIVICTTRESAGELLDKRAAVFSDRPRFVVGGELLSKGMHAGLVHYGELHRKHRRVLNNALHAKVIARYEPVLNLETKVFMTGLLDTPHDFEEHAKRFAASVIMTTTYDHPVRSMDDPIVKRIYEGASRFANSLAPGVYTVEALPWLNNLPLWLPGMHWKREVLEWAEEDVGLYKEMVDLTKQKIPDTTLGESFVRHMLANMEKYNLTDDEAAYLAGVLFAAATETVASAICNFILFMASFPDIQERARKEIYAYMGRDRLPTLAEVQRLPYLNALMKETLRFRPPAPMAVPHASIQDEYYNGYLIPKGTTIIGNVWSIHHDAKLYPDPTTFRPERFLENPDLPHYTFGFGRRACPGLHHAYSSLLVYMASILWAFDISPGVDENGVERKMDYSPLAFTEGGEASRPHPFKCDIKPRSQTVKDLLS